MFNQKGEVMKPTALCSSLALSFFFSVMSGTELCANNEQLVVSLTQEGLLRKARSPEPAPASKLWSVSSNVVAFNLYYTIVHINFEVPTWCLSHGWQRIKCFRRSHKMFLIILLIYVFLNQLSIYDSNNFRNTYIKAMIFRAYLMMW